MLKHKNIEEVFLYILRQDNHRGEINKGFRQFDDSDWRTLYEFAAKSGLFPICYNRLLNLNLENIPAEFLLQVKNIYFLNLKRNILLERELLRILAYFKELDIPIIPIKGPILARYLYNDSGLRQASCDLDLLVKYEAIDEAKRRLMELGYCFCQIDYKRDFLFPLDAPRQTTQIMFTRHIDGAFSVNLDLHWCIRGFYVINDIQRLWQEAGPFGLDGQKILLLSNEDTLLYLSTISISTLEFVQLKYIYDIHRLVTVFGEKLDWDKLLHKARHLNLENCLYCPLKLSTILFFTNIPKVFLNEIEPGWMTRKLISIWINEKSVLEFRQKTQINYILRCLLGRYFYSHSFSDFLRKAFRKILKGQMNFKLMPSAKVLWRTP